MKRAFFLAVVVCCMFASPLLAQTLEQKAIQNLAQNVVEQLPQDVHLRILVVTDIEGDDGTIYRALTQAIKEKTSFVLVEKADIDKVLNEHSWQVKDLVDPNTRVELGKMLAAEGILFGKVLEKRSSPVSATVRVHLQLDDLQRGTIVFAKEFTSTQSSPYKNTITLVAVIIIAVIVLGILIKFRTRVKSVQRLEKDHYVREDLTQEISKVDRNLAAVQDWAVEKDKQCAAEIKSSRQDLDQIRLEIESIAKGHIKLDTPEEIQKSLKLDESLAGNLKNLFSSSERIYAMAKDGEWKKVIEKVQEFKKDIKDTHNRLADRPIQ